MTKRKQRKIRSLQRQRDDLRNRLHILLELRRELMPDASWMPHSPSGYIEDLRSEIVWYQQRGDIIADEVGETIIRRSMELDDTALRIVSDIERSSDDDTYFGKLVRAMTLVETPNEIREMREHWIPPSWLTSS